MIQSIIFMAAVTALPVQKNDLEAQAGAALDDFHRAASQADFADYFSSFTDDAVFIGTDANERWSVEEFKKYAQPHFAKGRGWTYTSSKRHISFNKERNLAWFDEILANAKYGTSRGSGVLRLENNKWKIAQYHLTFPIPNDLAAKFTTEIKEFESKTKKPTDKAGG